MAIYKEGKKTINKLYGTVINNKYLIAKKAYHFQTDEANPAAFIILTYTMGISCRYE